VAATTWISRLLRQSTKEELQQGLKNVDRSSLITNKEMERRHIVPSRMRITKRKQTPFAAV